VHLGRNYPLILAGGGGFGVKHGQFHRFDENKNQLSDLFVTMLRAMGVPTDRFAGSNSNLDSTFIA
jgi:hypothetical protein